MVNEHKQSGPSRHPFQFINQFATRTKRYIDDIFTVSLGHMSELSLKNAISQEGTFLWYVTPVAPVAQRYLVTL